jgi:hypothetical protein
VLYVCLCVCEGRTDPDTQAETETSVGFVCWGIRMFCETYPDAHTQAHFDELPIAGAGVLSREDQRTLFEQVRVLLLGMPCLTARIVRLHATLACVSALHIPTRIRSCMLARTHAESAHATCATGGHGRGRNRRFCRVFEGCGGQPRFDLAPMRRTS